jgi:hypothetical protein
MSGRGPRTAVLVLGMAAAFGLGMAANEISGDSIGLSAQPLQPGQELAPPAADRSATEQRRRSHTTQRRKKAHRDPISQPAPRDPGQEPRGVSGSSAAGGGTSPGGERGSGRHGRRFDSSGSGFEPSTSGSERRGGDGSGSDGDASPGDSASGGDESGKGSGDEPPQSPDRDDD